MALTWLGLAILSTVGCHLVLKVTPATANPFLSEQPDVRPFEKRWRRCHAPLA